MQALLRELQDAIGKLNESKLNREFLQSDEFYALVTQAMRSAAGCYQSEKLRLFAQFLKGRSACSTKRTVLKRTHGLPT